MLKRWWPPVFIGALLVVFFGGTWYVDAVNQNHPAPWPMTGGGSGIRHYSPAAFPAEPALLWAFPVPDAVFTPPLIGADGTLYVDASNEVVAVGADGKRRWAWRSPERIWTMALSRYGLLYVMDSENLHALDEQGRLQFRAKLPGSPISPMVVGQGGTIYYAGGDRVHAVNDDGSHRWSLEVGTMMAGPVESSGGLVLVATTQRLFALRPGGEVEWSRTLGEPMPTRSLAAGPDGRIYLRTRSAVMVLNEKGEIKGESPINAQPTNLAIGEGVVQEGLTRRDGRAREQWTVSPGIRYRTVSTLVDGQGRILLMENQGMTRSSPNKMVPFIQYRLWDSEGGERWGLQAARPATEPAVDAKGNLCFIGRVSDREPVSLICVGDGPSAR